MLSRLLGKSEPIKIAFPKVWDRLELRPLEWQGGPSVTVRVAEIRVVENKRPVIVVSAPDVRALGPFGVNRKLTIRYWLPAGMVEAQTWVLEADDDAKVRLWTLSEPDKARIVQRREINRVPVFIPIELDVVQEANGERRVATYSGSVMDLNTQGALIMVRADTTPLLSVKSKVYLRFSLPDIGPLGEITATVTRLQKDRVMRNIQTRFSVRFLKMARAVPHEITKYCAEREKFLVNRERL